jgi:hypothetical protein
MVNPVIPLAPLPCQLHNRAVQEIGPGNVSGIAGYGPVKAGWSVSAAIPFLVGFIVQRFVTLSLTSVVFSVDRALRS